MSNKKRIRIKRLKTDESRRRRLVILGFKMLEVAVEIQKRIKKIESELRKIHPIGGIIQSKGEEIILDRDGNRQGVAIPLKRLEGMLALERTKDGSERVVFAGSRDYVAKQNTK